jgi:hypothetical protein
MFQSKCKLLAKYRKLWIQRMALEGWKRVQSACSKAA